MARFDKPRFNSARTSKSSSNFNSKSFRGGKADRRSSGKSQISSSRFDEAAQNDSDSGPEIGGFNDFDSGAESEDDMFYESGQNNGHNGTTKSKKKSKHAPRETKITKRPVSVVRDIPGLEVKKNYGDNDENGDNNMGGLHSRDIRFDTALGRSMDYETVRKQYAFLDEYREREVAEMQKVLNNKKLLAKMDPEEVDELKYRLQSTRSKLESLKKKDRERDALKKYIKESKDRGDNKFLTRAEKRKVLLVDRFEHMSSKEKNKSIERKRKRKLGKEMRALEFRHTGRD